MHNNTRLNLGKRTGVALACALVASTGGMAFTAAKATANRQAVADVDIRENALNEIRFKAHLASKRFVKVTAPVLAEAIDEAGADAIKAVEEVTDPFVQLSELGFDGEKVRAVADARQIDLTPISDVNLAAIDIDEIDMKERKCLTEAIYYEARNQSAVGQLAVADVVLNRVADKHYPNSICGVVYQGSHRTTGCQFSFTCDGSMKKRVEAASMRKARSLATAVLGGFRLPITGNALNYHATYVRPYWAPTLTKTAQVDDHIFYTPKRVARYAMARGVQ